MSEQIPTSDSSAPHDENPLLATSGLPRYDAIRPQHVVPAVRHVLAEAREKLAAIEQNVQPTWSGCVEPLAQLGRPFQWAWGPVGHLNSVMNSPELREAYETVLPEIVAFGLRVKQSRPIYDALKTIREGGEWQRLDEAQRRIVATKLLNAELSGVGLDGEARERFNEIERDLSQLSTDVSNHVLDATKAWSLVIRDPRDAEGLPHSLRQFAAQSYNQAKAADDAPGTAEDGPWRITLDLPSYVPFMQHCRSRERREQAYRAYVTRASSGEFDNGPLIVRTLKLRREQARLLGYRTYAEASLAEKMAPGVEAVSEMFERLRAASWSHAGQDLRELQDCAARRGAEFGGGHHEEDSGEAASARPPSGEPELLHWDIPFWSERLREERYGFTDEELRPYFPLERVLTGMFGLAERLFGVTVERADGEAPVWHPDVRFFRIFDEAGHVASFYLDPYSRPENKRGGAWMNTCFDRVREDGQVQRPVAHLVCNATPPVGERPALMTFREVETLFHEFGHGLQHMLTRVEYRDAAGINGIEWDAVELPSQFMENWCYHRPTLLGLTAHYETNAPLPAELFEKLKAARNHLSGTSLLRQLRLGMTDMALH
ncbi:MAG TPA: M3 family metallopeptidase, partial [Planctomycetaceae bacterium]|nr:M3 family metallopeptidase [Planctomycetaceae bacterium]